MPSHPVENFTMSFTGELGEMAFKVNEAGRSRDLAGGYSLVYNVIVDPHENEQMSDHIFSNDEKIALNDISDEILIAWNVWIKAGNTFFDESLIKKWPPDCKKVGTNQYIVTIKYAPLFVVNFQINPVRTKKFNDLETAAVYQHDGTGNFTLRPTGSMGVNETIGHSYINVDKDGKVQGVDVQDPILNWTERWSWGPQEDLWRDVGGEEVDYIQTLRDLSCTVNSYAFRGFKKGEVFFRSASGRYVSPLLWEIDYNFSARPTRTYITIGESIIQLGAEVRYPWNVADIEATKKKEVEVQDGVRTLLPSPDFIRIHKVYEFADFAGLLTSPTVKLSDAKQLKDADEPPSIGGFMQPPVEAT